MDKITSLQNPKIKQVVHLNKSSQRKATGLFVVEGVKEIESALSSKYTPKQLFFCPSMADERFLKTVLSKFQPSVECFEITEQVFEKISYREGSTGLVLVMQSGKTDLSSLVLPDNPFLIVLEAVEKPGNLGAILRTADAAAVDAVVICDPQTDIFNPNVIRSSLGCLFTKQVVSCTSQEAFDFLKSHHINIYAAELTASNWYYDTDFTNPSAIIMGTEADGLTPFWINNADARIKIPMKGWIDSLNVSVSTAVLTFEAMRQRNFRLLDKFSQ